MSETRQLWNPWRAKTRIAASRICRRRSTACALAMGRRLQKLRPAVRIGAAIRERGQRVANAVLLPEVELGEAEVVADGQAELEPAQRSEDDLLTRLLGRRLPVAHAADVDVEHVDLPVGGDDLAIGIDRD